MSTQINGTRETNDHLTKRQKRKKRHPKWRRSSPSSSSSSPSSLLLSASNVINPTHTARVSSPSSSPSVTMPSWWKRSKSAFHRSVVAPSSTPASPARASTSRAQPGRGGRVEYRDLLAPPRLTRQRKLRHVDDIDVGLGDLGLDVASSSPPPHKGRVSASEAVGPPRSTPISRSASSREAVAPPPRSASSPVLHPLPLPSPRPADLETQEPPGVADGWGEKTTPAPSLHAPRVTSQIVQKFPEHNELYPNGTKRATSGHHRNAFREKFQDKSSAETMNFRLNIPAKSAPSSAFSSPQCSPRRLSNADFSSTVPSTQGPHAWSAPSIRSMDFMGASSPRTSPEKYIGGPERSPCYSALRSPILMPRNTSAPPSPMHSKLFPENHISRTEGNGSINFHPLPLPPGALSPMQTTFSNQPAPKVEMPSVAGQWQKGKLLGSGTFGCVYEATNRHTGALCAMKEVNIIPDDAKSAESLKQLEQEIKFLSQFKHKNIVQYYGSDIIEDRFYIYLEYIHPGSINKYVKQHYGAMTESVVRNFTRHILRGLAFLHGQKIMHRDIKGANLLVDVHGVVKLADFGMAKHLGTAAPNLSLKGTPYWMAPEMVQATLMKDVGYDLAVDIWSLGCTIIEMFDGKPPWSDLEGPAAMFKVLHKDPPIPENLSHEGKDFLRCCFKRNPGERPTANELLDHPFIRNSNHYNKHGSIHSFAGIKVNENGHSSRDKPSSKSDPCSKGRNTTGEPSNSRPSEASTLLLTPLTIQAVTPNFSPRPLGLAPNYGSTANFGNTIYFPSANPQPSPLPRPNGKEVLF
ncbi:mitogen-activated protein kinase kinase kinase 5-like [Phragmites australis]|uniref:mitogen-activated protein kinase kinase kinase 5-like n=1 Tax=Phragmites australis TaxID=29695 RepID=UPI002D79C12E|nr:mitogen-activated protein kinase kinase kinase 5-like [Phragmites australis]